MTNTSAFRDIPTDDGSGLEFDEAELGEHWLARFTENLPLSENAFSIARPLWGKCQAEWSLCLAADLVIARPEAEGSEKREWTAAILWAAALDSGMAEDARLWSHIVHDITTATEVTESAARTRFDQLSELGLATPRNPPSYWR